MRLLKITDGVGFAYRAPNGAEARYERTTCKGAFMAWHLYEPDGRFRCVVDTRDGVMKALGCSHIEMTPREARQVERD